MNHNDTYNDRAAESMAMTYGMSEELLASDLLQRIDKLSISDKRCLVRYISEDVEIDQLEEDEWDCQDTSGLQPYTLDELYARIQESHEQYLRGEYYTAEQSDALLKEKYLWLQ
jgi:hypothetical protein